MPAFLESSVQQFTRGCPWSIFFGTNLALSPMLFKQAVLRLENSRRYTSAPITKFILSSTGLDEQHFHRIVLAVQRMPRLQGPTGRPDVNARKLEMRLDLLNASVFHLYMRDPLHQADHGLFA